MSLQETLDAIISSRIIAIVREPSADAAKREIERLVSAGVRAIEVSLSTPGALDVARWMVSDMRSDGLRFGVGTVLADQDVRNAAAIGATFIVSPIWRHSLVDTCKELGLVSVVGALTPTECIEATGVGADLVKLFPAKLWSPGTLKDLLKSIPFLKLVPTGGIRLSDATAWLEAGAVAVGIGSGLRSDGTGVALREALSAVAIRR